MSDVRLRARSTTEIVDVAFTLYRQQPLTYILAAAVGNVPSLIASLVIQSGSNNPAGATSLVGVLLLLVATVTYGIMSAVVIHLGSRAYLGQTMDLGAAIRETLPRTVTLVVAGFARTLIYGIALMALVVPFFYFFARYFAVIPAIALEGTGIAGAFNRSVVLSDGRKRHILNTLLLVWIIFFVVAAGVGTILSLLTAGNQVLSALVSTLLTVVIYPVLALTEMALYYDARIRAEGFDLEQMAASLGTPDVPPQPA
jgi:hypothetical protein